MNEHHSKQRFVAWRNAPATWAAYNYGLLINRIGWGIEAHGTAIMLWAAERLQRLAGAR